MSKWLWDHAETLILAFAIIAFLCVLAFAIWGIFK